MAMTLSNQVRIPSMLGLAGLLGLAAIVSSAGLSATPTPSAPQPAAPTQTADLPAAQVAPSPGGAVVLAERFPPNAAVRIYVGAPVAGAAFRAIGELRTDANGTAALQLDGTEISADGAMSVVVATPDFRSRATARLD